MSSRLPRRNDRVRFVNMNGHDHQRTDATEVLDTKTVYTVQDADIQNWYSYIKLEGIDQWFNHVMFELVDSDETY